MQGPVAGKSQGMKYFHLFAFGVPAVIIAIAIVFDVNPQILPKWRFLTSFPCVIEVNVIGLYLLRVAFAGALICNICCFCASAFNIFQVRRQIMILKARNIQASPSSAAVRDEIKTRFESTMIISFRIYIKN